MKTVEVNLDENQYNQAVNSARKANLDLDSYIAICLKDALSKPDAGFQQLTEEIVEENAELYKRLS